MSNTIIIQYRFLSFNRTKCALFWLWGDSFGYNIGGFTEKIEFVERTNFNNVSISFVHAERKTIREDPYGGLFDEFVVINDEQKNKLIKILSQDVVYFSWIDSQYHRNEYEMTKDQVFAMREMFLKFTELTSKWGFSLHTSSRIHHLQNLDPFG